uniref:Uncharacterized protein n=1 Tax=Pipistrellus kuhlii TaxID=59472 RepID=A0A7J7RZX8_PIPKU|nr:hypothetical protein mPipKuh1_010206 [Pipistrellus kuhlii]
MFTFQCVIQLEFVQSVHVLGAGSAGRPPSEPRASPAPGASLSPMGWQILSAQAVPAARFTAPLWAGGVPTPLTGLDLWQLGWEVSKTGADTNWFYSLIAACSFKTEQVLTSPSLFFWSVTWGPECAWALLPG